MNQSLPKPSRLVKYIVPIATAEASAKGELRAALRALRGPDSDFGRLAGLLPLQFDSDESALDVATLSTTLRFDGYLRRQEAAVHRRRTLEDQPIPVWFSYDGVAGLSREAIQRLHEVRPETIGQAGRIPGVTPAAVAVIAAHVARYTHKEQRSP